MSDFGEFIKEEILEKKPRDRKATQHGERNNQLKKSDGGSNE